MRRNRIWRLTGVAFVAALVGLVVPGGAAATDVTHRFDVGDDGWQVRQNYNLAPGPVTHHATGGVPATGGYISAVDSGSEATCPMAPSCQILEFLSPPLPSLSGNYGGFIRVHYRPYILPESGIRFIIDGSGGTLHWDSPIPPTIFTQISKPLTPQPDWVYCSLTFMCHFPPTEGEFKAVLAGASSVVIRADVSPASFETYALDNFRISEPPAPPAAAAASLAPVAAATPARATAKKCRKGRKLKRGRCVRKKKKK